MQDLDSALDSLLVDRYGGFWKRLLASIIDTLLLLAVILPLSLIIYGTDYFDPSTQEAIAFDFLNLVLNNILPIIAILLCWHFLQATPGKMLLNMKIVDAATGNAPSTKQYIVRYLGYILSTLPLCLGLIWIAFDKKKQGWHDKLAKTLVVQQ